MEGCTYNIGMGCCEPVLAPIQNYYTKSQIDRMISGITVSGVTQEELDAAIESAKTEIEAEIPVVPTQVSAFENDVPYLTEHQSLSAYSTTQEMNEAIASAKSEVESEIPSLSGYATEEWVEEKHYITGMDLSDYATTAYVNTEISAQTGDFVDGEELSSYTYDKATIDSKIVSGGTFDPTLYYDKAATDELLDEKLDASAYTPVDLSDYYTKSETNSQISSATADMATQTWVDNQGYLTEHQSLSEYYTKSEVNGIVTSAVTDVESEIPSLSGYATEEWVTDQNYITGVDLSNYATKSEIPVVPTNVSAFNNDAGYLTEHQSLSAYSTTAEVDIMIGTATSGKAETSALTSVDDVLTAHTSDSTIHVTSSDKEAWNGKQDALTPGEGIVISGNVISATGGSSVTVDQALDSGSTNPIANSAVTNAVNVSEMFFEVGNYSSMPTITQNDVITKIVINTGNRINSDYNVWCRNGNFDTYTSDTFYPYNSTETNFVKSYLIRGGDSYYVVEAKPGYWIWEVSFSRPDAIKSISIYKSVNGGVVSEVLPNVADVLSSNLVAHTSNTNIHHTSTSAVTSGSTDVVTSGGVYEQVGGLKFQKMTLQEYSTISGSADSNTIYFIKD